MTQWSPTHSDLSDRWWWGKTRDQRSSQFEIGRQTEANRGRESGCKQTQPRTPSTDLSDIFAHCGKSLVGGRVAVLVARVTYTLGWQRHVPRLRSSSPTAISKPISSLLSCTSTLVYPPSSPPSFTPPPAQPPHTCPRHQSHPRQKEPERPRPKARSALSRVATPVGSVARFATPPSRPYLHPHSLTLPTEVRRTDDRRGELPDLRPPPPPVPRLRGQASRVAAGIYPLHRPCVPLLLTLFKESRTVVDIREKIKSFLASQGMIKGHSGSGPRTSEQEPQILHLSSDYVSPSTSPQTPTLSITSSHEERFPSTYPPGIRVPFDTDRKIHLQQAQSGTFELNSLQAYP